MDVTANGKHIGTIQDVTLVELHRGHDGLRVEVTTAGHHFDEGDLNPGTWCFMATITDRGVEGEIPGYQFYWNVDDPHFF